MHQENWVAFNMVPPGLDISLRCHPSKRLLPLHTQGKHGSSFETGMEKHKIQPQYWGSGQAGPPPASLSPPSTCYCLLARGNPSVWAYLWPESAPLPQRSFFHFFLKLSLSFKAELKLRCPFLEPTPPVRQQCFETPHCILTVLPAPSYGVSPPNSLRKVRRHFAALTKEQTDDMSVSWTSCSRIVTKLGRIDSFQMYFYPWLLFL